MAPASFQFHLPDQLSLGKMCPGLERGQMSRGEKFRHPDLICLFICLPPPPPDDGGLREVETAAREFQVSQVLASWALGCASPVNDSANGGHHHRPRSLGGGCQAAVCICGHRPWIRPAGDCRTQRVIAASPGNRGGVSHGSEVSYAEPCKAPSLWGVLRAISGARS